MIRACRFTYPGDIGHLLEQMVGRRWNTQFAITPIGGVKKPKVGYLTGIPSIMYNIVKMVEGKGEPGLIKTRSERNIEREFFKATTF